MKILRLIRVKTLFGFAAAFSLSLPFALGLVSTAQADVGGLLYECYSGNIPTNTLCTQKTFDFNQAGFFGRAIVNATYLPQREGSSSNVLRLDIELEINDPQNTFQAFGSVGTALLTHTYSFHRERVYSAKGLPVILNRDYGTTRLKGSFSIELEQNFGAEYVEYIDTLEVLIPGLAERINIDL